MCNYDLEMFLHMRTREMGPAGSPHAIMLVIKRAKVPGLQKMDAFPPICPPESAGLAIRLGTTQECRGMVRVLQDTVDPH